MYPNNSKDSIQTSVTSAENVKQDSDDEEELERSSTTVVDDFGTGNQDDDDLATLDDLAWELVSSTGRLTHCEQDIIDMDRRYIAIFKKVVRTLFITIIRRCFLVHPLS